MLPGVAFILYLAVGSILIITFLFLCVRISVFFEDTCQTRFCLRRKQRKQRKTLIQQMLFPNDPDSPRGGAPPSDENITADIICQPYIYRDAYSTGLTQLSGLSLLANLPLTVALSDGNPSDAVVTNSNSVSDQFMRLTTIRRSRPSALTQQDSANRNSTEETQISVPEENSDSVIPITDDEEAALDQTDLESLPPDYSNVTNNNESSIRIDNVSLNDNDEPPPSYNECVKAL